MCKRTRLYIACAAVVAMIPAAPLKAEVRSFGTIEGEYTLVEADGPTRSEPEPFSYEDDKGNTIRGSVWCREDLPVGTTYPGALQNFTVDTTTGRVSFVLDGEPVNMAAYFLHTNVGRTGGTVIKGTFVEEESESPDPAVKIVYRTEAEVSFNTSRIGAELKATMLETTSYIHKGETLLECGETYVIAGYRLPRPPMQEFSIMDRVWGSVLGSIRSAVTNSSMKSGRSSNARFIYTTYAVFGVRG